MSMLANGVSVIGNSLYSPANPHLLPEWYCTINGGAVITNNGMTPAYYFSPASPFPATISQESPVVITGKQFVVVCDGRVEYCDDKAKAQETAERLAHAHQVDAFILKPVSRTAPKRDVVTTEIKL